MSEDQRDERIKTLSTENQRLTVSNTKLVKSNGALAQKNARLSERILDAEDEIRRLVEERDAPKADAAKRFLEQEANGHACSNEHRDSHNRAVDAERVLGYWVSRAEEAETKIEQLCGDVKALQTDYAEELHKRWAMEKQLTAEQSEVTRLQSNVEQLHSANIRFRAECMREAQRPGSTVTDNDVRRVCDAGEVDYGSARYKVRAALQEMLDLQLAQRPAAAPVTEEEAVEVADAVQDDRSPQLTVERTRGALEAFLAKRGPTPVEQPDFDKPAIAVAKYRELFDGAPGSTQTLMRRTLFAQRVCELAERLKPMPALNVAAAQAECEACGYPAPDANAMAHILAAAQCVATAPVIEQLPEAFADRMQFFAEQSVKAPTCGAVSSRAPEQPQFVHASPADSLRPNDRHGMVQAESVDDVRAEMREEIENNGYAGNLKKWADRLEAARRAEGGAK